MLYVFFHIHKLTDACNGLMSVRLAREKCLSHTQKALSSLLSRLPGMAGCGITGFHSYKLPLSVTQDPKCLVFTVFKVFEAVVSGKGPQDLGTKRMIFPMGLASHKGGHSRGWSTK